MPNPTTAHMHCFESLHIPRLYLEVYTSPRRPLLLLFFVLSSQIIWQPIFLLLLPFFFLTNLLVADFSSSSSYLDRIGTNWGCLRPIFWPTSMDFSRFQSELARISSELVRISLNWCELLKKKSGESTCRVQIGVSKRVGCVYSGLRAAPVLPR